MSWPSGFRGLGWRRPRSFHFRWRPRRRRPSCWAAAGSRKPARWVTKVGAAKKVRNTKDQIWKALKEKSFLKPPMLLRSLNIRFNLLVLFVAHCATDSWLQTSRPLLISEQQDRDSANFRLGGLPQNNIWSNFFACWIWQLLKMTSLSGSHYTTQLQTLI